MAFDRRSSLTQLEGKDWGPPTYDSGLVRRCHAARYKPVGDLDADELRMLLGQDIGTHYILPLAIERLASRPFGPSDDLWPGALLSVACEVAPSYWNASPALFHVLQLVVKRTLVTGQHSQIADTLRSFADRERTIEPMSLSHMGDQLAQSGLSDDILYWLGAPDDSPRDEGLEAAIAEALDDLGRYEVYADWLLERGEPRGELIQAQCRVERAGATPSIVDRRTRLLELHGARWCGPAVIEPPVRLEWKRGFVHSVFFVDDPLADSRTRFHTWIASEVLKRPAFAFVRSFGTRMLDRDLVDFDDQLGFVVDSMFSNMRFVEVFRFEWAGDDEFHDSDALSGLASRLPALREMQVSDSVEPPELPPHVKLVVIANE